MRRCCTGEFACFALPRVRRRVAYTYRATGSRAEKKNVDRLPGAKGARLIHTPSPRRAKRFSTEYTMPLTLDAPRRASHVSLLSRCEQSKQRPVGGEASTWSVPASQGCGGRSAGHKTTSMLDKMSAGGVGCYGAGVYSS